MHTNFVSYFYLQYFHQHVSASNPAIFRVMFFDTRIQLQLNVSPSLYNIKNIRVPVEIFLNNNVKYYRTILDNYKIVEFKII